MSRLQEQINRMRYMEDDIEDFEAFISGREDYFGNIFHNALIDMKAMMPEEKWQYQQLKSEQGGDSKHG